MGRGDREGERREEMEGGREGEVKGLHAKFHVNVFTVLASDGRKPQFLENFDFWDFCTGPLLSMSQIWCAKAE